MNAVGPEEGRAIPKQVKIVNKNCPEVRADRLQPGVEAKGPAKTANASLEGSSGAGDKNSFATVFKKIQEPAKILF